MNPESLHDDLEAFVSYDEPDFEISGPQVRQLAVRKRGRRRRVNAVSAALAAAIAAGTTYAFTLAGNDSQPDLASDGPPTDYSSAAFPTTIETVVSDSLGEVPSDFSVSAHDFTMNPLEGAKRDKAMAWQAEGSLSPDRVLNLFLTYSPAETEGTADTYCQDRASYLVSCEVLLNEARVNIIDTVVMAQSASEPFQWRTLTQGEEPSTNRPIWFVHEVAIRRDAQYLTVAKEAVRAETLDQARAGWQISTDDLQSLAADPRLIFPAPPPGANGCPLGVEPDGPGEMECGGSPPASP